MDGLTENQQKVVDTCDVNLKDAGLPYYSEAVALLRDIEHIRDKLADFRPDLVERLRKIAK